MKPARGLYCGLTLAEWRGSIRVLQASGWWRFANLGMSHPPASTLHFAVIQAATLLLPTRWHSANAGRFSEQWYRNRRSQVNGRFYWKHRPPFQENPLDPPTL